MNDAQERINDVAGAVCDGLRQIGDFSFAILPKDIAHALGNFQTAILSEVRKVIDWEINWTEARVEGGDKLRDDWREKCHHNVAEDIPPSAV
ncbi:MAG TPA: hypothetical protein VI306_10790 [Pyrinomonadaceae bacterium]